MHQPEQEEDIHWRVGRRSPTAVLVKGGEGGEAAGVVREHRLRGAAAAVVVGAEPAGAAQGLEDPLRLPARRGAAPEGTAAAQAGKSSSVSFLSSQLKFASGTVE